LDPGQAIFAMLMLAGRPSRKFWLNRSFGVIMKTLFFLAASALAAAPVVLVENGRSTYRICLSPQASAAEQRGAVELQRFLEEMSGARLTVATRCGSGPGIFLKYAPEFGAEEFTLKTVGPNIVISGGRPRGVMYGAYTFLEKLGCRWFSSSLSRIPKRKTVRVEELDDRQKPAFEMRWPGITEATEKDWAARNKLNGGGLALDASTGGRVEWAPYGHSFYWLLPPGKFFAEHPDYFALVEGKRRNSGAQLCLTNPGTIRAGVEHILRWLEEHPEVDIVGVCQEDWGGWCECDNCRRVEREEGGAHSGPIVRFVNALAEEVTKKYPDKRILTYAYQYSETAPARARPHPNVRIQLAPISACVGHPGEECPLNKALLMDNLKGWSRLTNQIYMYGYATNFSHFLYPFPDFYRLAADIPMLKRIGVAGIYYESSHQGNGGENAELRAFVMAKMFWNPSENMERLVDEYMEAAYGKAARPMRAVFDLMHREVRFPPNGKGKHLWIFQAPWLPDDVVEQARRLYSDAMAAAAGEAERSRIRKASLWVEYAALFEQRRFEMKDGWYTPGDVDSLKERFARWWKSKTELGVGYLNNDRLEDDKAFLQRLKPYRVLTIENAVLRADIVPELSGRIVRLIDKRTGGDIARKPNPTGSSYPDGAGIFAAVHPDPGGDGFAANWEVESQTGAMAVLRGTLTNGLVIRRKIELAGASGVLRLQSVLENRGNAPKNAQLLTRFDTMPARVEDVASEERPGEIVTRDKRSGLKIEARFPAGQTSRAFVARDDKHGRRSSIVLWTPQKLLATGETVRLDVDYTVTNEAVAADQSTKQEWKDHAAGGGRIELSVAGRPGYLILPKKPASADTLPWVWYAPVIGGQFPRPETDWLFTRLLQNGIAIAGADVGESYGSPQGVAQFTQFYRLAVEKYHLASKACLVPQSRGGLMLYNWAIANPELVKCIGGIYTVTNLASYPGLARASSAYGMSVSEMQDKLHAYNPPDRLAPLAAERVPILHLHGDSDKIVPLEENSLELRRRYQSLGGEMQLFVIKGKGHQVDPGFFNSQVLLDFLVAHSRPSH
jgi:pimeloyl-ACP methyl ester carboxylesterase